MIHFNLTESKNYAGVQEQILDSIKQKLPDGIWTESNEYRKGFLNFSLFINQKSDILMSHGAADKNYHFKRDINDKAKRLNHTMERQHIFVPGKWLKDRIVKSKHLNFDENHVHEVGWPRLDKLLAELDLKNSKPRLARKKVVLWAPTHDFARRGEDAVSLSSYPEFSPFYEKMSNNYEMLQSLHPRNRKDKTPTKNALVDADVVITDFGTMVYEAVALGKQVIFPSWIIGNNIREHLKYSAESVIFSEKYGLHAESFSELKDMIEDHAEIDERSREFFNKFLPTSTYGNSCQLIADLLVRLSAE